MYCSADGGTTYQFVGLVTTPALYGTLTATLGSVADPDTTSTLAIVLANTNLQLPTTATHGDADNGLTLCLVGSGSNAEVISYGASALSSGGHYNLTYLRRNLYGSLNASHSSSALFARLDGAIFQLPIDPGQAGQTLWFKFTSYNTWGQAVESLAGVTAYSYAVPNANPVSGIATLIPRGSCAISGQTVYKATTGSGAYDSDCYSNTSYPVLSISGQFSAAGTSAAGGTFLGFTTSTASVAVPATSTNIYGFFASPASSANVVEVFDGTSVLWSSGTAPVKNDLFQSTYDGFTIRHYYNGSLVAAAQHQSLALFAYIDMYSPGAAFSNVETTVGALATPTQFVCSPQCIVNDTNASKLGGSSGFDSAVWSVIGYSACHIAAKINSAGESTFIGLSTQPVPTTANISGGTVNAQANFAFYANEASAGMWGIYESGTLVFSTGVLSAVTDVVWITYDGATVRYYLNDPATPVKTTTAAGLFLYGFMSFFTAAIASGVNTLRFGPTTNLAVADTAQIGANAATAVYQTTVAGSTGIIFNPAGTAALVASLSVPAQTFDATYVITVTGNVVMNATGNVFTCNAELVDASASTFTPTAQNQICTNGSTSSPAASNGFAIEQSTTITAGTAKTYYLYGTTNATTFTFQTASIANVNLKVEIIKR